jgi:hypothetical protein
MAASQSMTGKNGDRAATFSAKQARNGGIEKPRARSSSMRSRFLFNTEIAHTFSMHDDHPCPSFKGAIGENAKSLVFE